MPTLRTQDAWPVAVVADAVAVLVFATVGRASHHESIAASGVWHTAWPFLLGTALGLAVSTLTRSSPTTLRNGVRVWIWAVGIGMVVRASTGAGTAPAFVVVALVVLGAFMLGWRLALLRRGRRSRWRVVRRTGL